MKTDMSILLTTIQHKVVVGTDVNQLWDTFTDTLQESINNHIPQKIAKAKDKFPWITKEIKQMIKRRDRMYKRKKNPTIKVISTSSKKKNNLSRER